MEPGNVADKQAVCVRMIDEKVRHLLLEKNGKFVKLIFHFFEVHIYAKLILHMSKILYLHGGEIASTFMVKDLYFKTNV